MGINNILEQQTAETMGANPTVQSRPTSSGGSIPTPEAADAPNVRTRLGGQPVILDTMTLVFYGVVLADLLLLYIALRV